MSSKNDVLVNWCITSYCYCNELPQLWWLKTMQNLLFYSSRRQKSYFDKIKLSVGLVPSGISRGTFPFSAFRGCLNSLAGGPFLHFQSQQHSIFKPLSLRPLIPSSHLLSGGPKKILLPPSY